MSSTRKANCWEVRKCGRGPGDPDPCPGTSCFGQPPQGDFIDKQEVCLSCAFFQRVRDEEGSGFRFVKLAQGIQDTAVLHARIAQVEALMGVRDHLRARFNPDAIIAEVTRQARVLTQAQRCLVLLMRGDPPILHGEFRLRGKMTSVDIPVDGSSAVGFAAANNKIVNVKDPYQSPVEQDGIPFNQAFDDACKCHTNSLLAVPVRDSDGKVLGVITAANSRKGSFSQDDQWFIERYAVELGLAMERARLLQDAVAAGRMASISESLAGLSHFLKDVAHALMGTSFIIRRAIDQGRMDDIKGAWEILDRHVKRLAELCKDVLTYDPDRPDEICPGSLNGTVSDAVSLLQAEARTRAVELATDLGPGLTRWPHSKRGIYRCVVNLVVNAFDACLAAGGRVTVATECRDGRAIIRVSDDGRGMDAAARENVAEIFKTGDKRRGSGIGLPTVVDIVRRHGGRLDVASEPGEGSTFSILLPRAQ
jgi:signal transduction histidine kinase